MTEPKFSIQTGDKKIDITLDSLAEQAGASCRVQMGDTVVLVTAVMSGKETHLPFFPLTVEYEERFYAAGKILGSRFVRREGRPSDEAIIAARLIDRSIRPLFPKHLKREVQIITTTLSWDGENDPDILGLVGASFALTMSNIPWNGPIAGIRIGKKGNEFILNPSYEERGECSLDFVLAGTEKDGELVYNMIEAESTEATEEDYEKALDAAKGAMNEMVKTQREAQASHGKEKTDIPAPEPNEELESEMRSWLADKLKEALFTGDRQQRMSQAEAVQDELIEHIQEKYPEEDHTSYIKDFVDKEIDRIVHEAAINDGKRVDDRAVDEIRAMEAQVGVLPRTHGSGLYFRGQTKSLSLLTLGAPGDHKLVEGMEVRGKKRFMHHYNFPPYAPGEAKKMMGPGRREIGHGMLAEKSLLPLIPDFNEFPYTIRIVTEILSSNGSTSMASVCSSSLALMDAGVPIKRPVAGTSLGLMSDDNGNYKILTDIQGPEDHHGDMDFKVGGTKEGINAVQLDVKISGITEQMFKEALARAKTARNHIIDTVLSKTIEQSREELSAYAPKISIVTIDPSKIGMVIGPGGKVINGMIADYGVEIDIDDETGQIFISSDSPEDVKDVVKKIEDIVKEVEVGTVYEGVVKKVVDFGAFVEVLPGQEGLLHISELAPHRVEKVTDIVNEGDTISVKVTGIDEQGKIRLSHKEIKNL